MRLYKIGLALYLLFLCACSSTAPSFVKQDDPHADLYLDNQFYSDNKIVIESEKEVFHLDDEMRAMVHTQLRYKQTAQQKAYALLKHLFDSEQVSLAYEGNANLTASQAYYAKVANCLSLTIMAYSLADEAGLNVNFREVKVPEYWVRNGQYSLLTGHVNLIVTDDLSDENRTLWTDTATVIDFDPFVAKKKFPARKIKKKTILAMFYNNKGADALSKNNFEEAYQYIKQATLTDNKLSSAWGNLGVLYKLAGYEESAELVYIRAINLQSDNLNSLANLAMLYNKQARQQEAKPIEDYLYKLRSGNPYYYALLANEALYSEDYQSAVKHYKKAISLDDQQHEFYFGLAKAYYQQDRLALSKVAMKRAASLTQVKHTETLYLAKLNFLRDKDKVQVKLQ